MRMLFWILLLANVVLFAIMHRGGFGWGEQPYQPQPALDAEKIRLVDVPQSAVSQSAPAPQGLPARAMQNSVPVAGPAGAPAQLAASAPVVNHGQSASHVPANPARAASSPPSASTAQAVKPASAALKQDGLVCLEWGDFSGTDLKRATEALSALQLGEKLSERQIQYDKGYWVYIPPLKNKAAANRKTAQIKALGIKEYFIVQDTSAMRYAISLGVFKTRETAQNYLNELNAKGVRAVRVGERSSKLKTTVFRLNGVDAPTEAKLAITKKGFPGSELKNVPCGLTK